jgi:hypothetical protein
VLRTLGHVDLLDASPLSLLSARRFPILSHFMHSDSRTFELEYLPFRLIANPDALPLLVSSHYLMSHLLVSLQIQLPKLLLKWLLINDANTEASYSYFELMFS